MKGARVNFSSKGTYVNFGSHGIYYRKKISGHTQKRYQDAPQYPTQDTLPSNYEQHTITSGNVEQITDIDSQDFINELTEKNNKISYYNWFGLFPLVLATVIFLYTFFSTTTKIESKIVTETKDYIKPVSSNINIRQTPEKDGIVLGVIKSNEQAELLDESEYDWYKINFNGLQGYAFKKITEKTQATSSHEDQISVPSIPLAETNKPLFWGVLMTIIVFFTIILSILKRIDNRRLLIEIYYDIDSNIQEVYQKFVYHFSEILNCSKVWQYLHSQKTYDYKYSSGASDTITRKPLNKISKNKTPLKIFKTNVEIPYLGLINTELYFFPERLIIKRGNQFGAIMYKNIDCYSEITRFIESEGVPNDSVVVGQTWRYLNKNGSPDRRFSNNYQIPICNYSEYSFISNSGLNEKICTSKVGGIDDFIRYIRAIGHVQKHMPSDVREENVNNSLLK